MIIIQLAKFFLSSLIWGMAAATVRLPPLLGYILSGILLGPSLSKYMTESTIEWIRLAGEFGLLMLMFIAGLELDIGEFTGHDNEWVRPILAVFYQILFGFIVILSIWTMPQWVFQNYLYFACVGLLGIGVLILFQRLSQYILDRSPENSIYFLTGFLGSIFAGLVGGIYFGLLKTNTIFTAQTMFLASCILALNSTAVAIKLLENRDKKNTLIGTSVISILIAQDLAIIIMMIALESLGSGNLSIVNLSLKVFIAVFVLYLVKLFSDHSPSWVSDFLDYIFKINKELTVLFAITLCFGFAAIADSFGFSDIYGAFIAGLILGNIYKHDKYIIKICEPISNILMTLFFMWLGILFNINEIINKWLPITIISVLIFAFKYFSNFTIIKNVYHKTSGLTDGCIMLCSIILTQMSEFSIIMIALVARSLMNTDLSSIYTCDLTKLCVITSLSIGSIATVVIKNWLYKQNYIE